MNPNASAAEILKDSELISLLLSGGESVLESFE